MDDVFDHDFDNDYFPRMSLEYLLHSGGIVEEHGGDDDDDESDDDDEMCYHIYDNYTRL